jgi:hypothetical protein
LFYYSDLVIGLLERCTAIYFENLKEVQVIEGEECFGYKRGEYSMGHQGEADFPIWGCLAPFWISTVCAFSFFLRRRKHVKRLLIGHKR